MKYIITETHSLFLKRRLKEIDQHVKESFKIVDPNDYTYHDFVEEIAKLDLNTVTVTPVGCIGECA